MENLYGRVRGLSTAIKDVGRLREIVAVLARHGFGALVTRLDLQDTTGVKGLMPYRDDRDQKFTLAQRIRMTIEDLGPTFIKLGQILSTRPDLVPADIIEELQHLQDNVPIVPYEAIAKLVEQELQAPIATTFAEFDREPIASASVAQVHRAILAHETEVVVVKVQRPGIVGAIESDLNILHFLARQIEKQVPDLALMDPVGIVAEFERAMGRELDFANERRNMHTFRHNLRELEGISIPRVHDAYCTSRVLTMELIDGVKVTQAGAKLNVDPYPVARRMLNALFHMIFRDGIFHGDLHPGNILIQARPKQGEEGDGNGDGLVDGHIFLIDFGLVGRLTRKQRENILDILIGLSRNDYQLVARVFFELGIKQPGVVYNYEAFEGDVVDVMDRHLAGKTIGEVDVGAFFADLVSGAIRHRIKMPPTYTMVFKALMTVEGIGKTLAPDLQLVEEAKPFVTEMLAQRYDPQRIIKEGIDSLAGANRFLRVFPQLATGLLSDLSEGRITLRHDVEGVDRYIRVQQHGHRQVARAILASSCVIGGAIALANPGPVVLGVPAIPVVIFAVAGWLSFRLWVSGLKGP